MTSSTFTTVKKSTWCSWNRPVSSPLPGIRKQGKNKKTARLTFCPCGTNCVLPLCLLHRHYALWMSLCQILFCPAPYSPCPPFPPETCPASRPSPKILLFDRKAGINNGCDFLFERGGVVHSPVGYFGRIDRRDLENAHLG